jgi:hypothetical protein
MQRDTLFMIENSLSTLANPKKDFIYDVNSSSTFADATREFIYDVNSSRTLAGAMIDFIYHEISSTTLTDATKPLFTTKIHTALLLIQHEIVFMLKNTFSTLSDVTRNFVYDDK